MKNLWRLPALSLSKGLLLLLAPAPLAAQIIPPPQVNLSWQDNSDNEDGFFIYRSVDGTDFFALDSIGEDAATYADTALIPGQTYWWHVTAYNTAGESGPSNTVSRTIPQPLPPRPAAPGNFDVTLPPQPARMVNVSVRTMRTPNEGTPIAGMVISGDLPARVLLRAVGPGLIPLQVPSTLPNPRLAVFRGQTQIASNDDWNAADTELTQAFGQVFAFPLTPGSSDAAMVLTLDPGQYTIHAQVSPGTPETGIVLLEAYQLPPQPFTVTTP